MKLEGLSKKLMLWMSSMAGLVLATTAVSIYGFYAIWDIYWPDSYAQSSDLMPSVWELLWLLAFSVATLVIASIIGVRLARRILVPLNSVTRAIQAVAQGDLTARADAGHESLGEAAVLANDFNKLAEKLERVTQEQKFWNAAIAHELRTPVTILRGRLQGMADGVFALSNEQILKLLGSVESLSRLIEDLRTVGLVDAGHLSLQTEYANLDSEIMGTVQFFTERFAASGHHCEVDLDLPVAWCDPMRMKQALLALFENVHKHASPGLVTVTSRSISDSEYEITVNDEGPGIPEELASNIFDAFRQAERGASSGGSGLGLAVVAAIAKAHGGKATYQRLPTGSRFAISWLRQ